MSDHQMYYWETLIDDDGAWRKGGPPGDQLAALRRGLGFQPGTVPQMWRFHRCDLNDDQRSNGWVTDRYTAEHHALTLFATHQQSQSRPVHQPGRRLGTAVASLHGSNSPNPGVERRFYAMVSSETVDEVAYHLRGLIYLMRSHNPTISFDYTLLMRDLSDWPHPDRRDRVRRRWGLQYTAPDVDRADQDSGPPEPQRP